MLYVGLSLLLTFVFDYLDPDLLLVSSSNGSSSLTFTIGLFS